jgi:adenosylcobinamide-GDP ribazoletransferase
MRVTDGLRLALTTFTVAPVRAGRIDRRAAAQAMALAPVMGALLGVALAATGLAFAWLGAPPLLAGAVTVAVGVLLTRGLHIDGLADTVDGLGSYRDAAGTLDVMRKPDVGPFGVAAVALALLIQAAGIAAVLSRPAYAAALGIVVATATGRLAVTWACRTGVPAARPDGLGALVAGTVNGLWATVALACVAALSVPAAPGRGWQGPLAVVVGLAGAVLLTRHVVGRIGGITGDVLGAVVEVAATLAYVVLSLS